MLAQTACARPLPPVFPSPALDVARDQQNPCTDLLEQAGLAACWHWRVNRGDCKTLDSGSTQGRHPENTGLFSWSPALEVLLECNRVTPEPWRCPADLLSPRERSALIATLQHDLSPGQVLEIETTALTGKGRQLPVRLLMQCTQVQELRIWHGVLQDRSEHQQRVDEARRVRLQLGTTLASMTEAFATLDHDGYLTYVNPRTCQLLGRSHRQLLGLRLGRELPEPAGDRLESALQQALHTGQPTELEVFSSTLDKWLELRLYPFDEGVALYLRDVSERHRTQEQLLLLHTCIAQLNDTVLITEQRSGQEPSIVFANQAFSRLSGYSTQELMGRHPRLLHGPLTQGRELDRIARAMTRWQPVRSELVHYKKDGGTYWVELEVVPVDESPRGITHWVAVGRDITARKAQDDAIEHLAFYDPLTELPNRQLLMQRLSQALTHSSASASIGALMFIDLDHFKLLNDTMGHDRGDALLQQVAARLRACVQEGNTVARLGGDEFVVVMENLAAQAQAAGRRAKQTAQLILRTLAQPYELAGQPYYGTCSIGVTLLTDHEQGVGDLLKQADLAMYQAKASGRNTVCLFDPQMQAAASAKAALTAELRQGLREEQFELHYQPQVRADGRICGAEALLRWRYRAGLRGPDSFIAQAEDSGLILPLGQWVLDSACQQLARWAKRPLCRDLRLSVNVSPRQFLQPQFVEQVLQAVARHAISPEKLELEITESLLATDMQGTNERMQRLRQAGLSLAIDDFGMGYSALACLKHMPLQRLKIDRAFVKDMLEDPKDAAIARTIIALANDLGLQVIAEGVETRAQRDLLAANGCHVYQGFLFSPALAAEQFESFIAGWSPSVNRVGTP